MYILAYKMSTKLTEKDYPTAIVHGRRKNARNKLLQLCKVGYVTLKG